MAVVLAHWQTGKWCASSDDHLSTNPIVMEAQEDLPIPLDGGKGAEQNQDCLDALEDPLDPIYPLKKLPQLFNQNNHLVSKQFFTTSKWPPPFTRTTSAHVNESVLEQNAEPALKRDMLLELYHMTQGLQQRQQMGSPQCRPRSPLPMTSLPSSAHASRTPGRIQGYHSADRCLCHSKCRASLKCQA